MNFYRLVRSARRRRILLAATLFVAVPGCGSSRDLNLLPVNGRVLYKGKPLTGGVVLFEREGDQSAASDGSGTSGPLRATGQIQADGRFQLNAFEGALGVPQGRYRVGVSSVPPRTEANIFGGTAVVKKGDPDVLRGRYIDPKTSGLRCCQATLKLTPLATLKLTPAYTLD